MLKEDTPGLDTFQARRRIRLVVGGVLSALILISGVVVYRTLAGPGDDADPPPDEPPFAGRPDPARDAAAREAQAGHLLDDARQYERKGKPDQALQRLDRLANAYPGTAAARQAGEARDRHARGQPLFPERPIELASAEPPPEPEPEPVPEPEGVPPPGPGPEPDPAPPVPAEPPPAVPPEPYRDTGLARPRAEVAARPLPTGFRPRIEAGVHPSGWPLEITCDRDGSALVLVPGGAFRMGHDRGRPSERPAHEVVLGTFYIDQHEVTNRQYYHLYLPTRPVAPPAETPPDDDRPVVQVTLDEARAYAAWAGKRLPTEAQWECAARSADARLQPWGAGPPDWASPRLPRQIDPVMTFPTDLAPCGAFDLAGNAWEWTTDWFDTRYFDRFRDRPAVDPTGPASSRARIPEVVVKGGSAEWDLPWRSGMRPEARLPYLGFRCVLPVEPASPPPPPPANPQAAPRHPDAPVPF